MARNKWKRNHNGMELRSGFEKKTATFLDEMEVNYKYEETKLEYMVPATKRSYTPDFQLPNGIYVECKGRFTPEDRRKMALVIEQHPDKDIRMMFMQDNPINKNSKTTYSMWCKARGIICHVDSTGKLPMQWLNKRATRKGRQKNNTEKKPNE